MAYLDQANRHSPGSMLAALGVQGTIIAAMVLGLSVSGIVKTVDTRTEATNIKLPPPPPPPEPDEKPRERVEREIPRVFVPAPPIPINDKPIDFGTSEELVLDFSEFPEVGQGSGTGSGETKEPILSYDPVRAKPRNDPAGWVTTRDYRSHWIRREMVGTARFRLEIAASGAVTGCSITGTTGHSQLDSATCSLVSRRAKFQPARDSRGEAIAGSYSSAVSWELPE